MAASTGELVGVLPGQEWPPFIRVLAHAFIQLFTHSFFPLPGVVSSWTATFSLPHILGFCSEALPKRCLRRGRPELAPACPWPVTPNHS